MHSLLRSAVMASSAQCLRRDITHSRGFSLSSKNRVVGDLDQYLRGTSNRYLIRGRSATERTEAITVLRDCLHKSLQKGPLLLSPNSVHCTTEGVSKEDIHYIIDLDGTLYDIGKMLDANRKHAARYGFDFKNNNDLWAAICFGKYNKYAQKGALRPFIEKIDSEIKNGMLSGDISLFPEVVPELSLCKDEGSLLTLLTLGSNAQTAITAYPDLVSVFDQVESLNGTPKSTFINTLIRSENNPKKRYVLVGENYVSDARAVVESNLFAQQQFSSSKTHVLHVCPFYQTEGHRSIYCPAAAFLHNIGPGAKVTPNYFDGFSLNGRHFRMGPDILTHGFRLADVLDTSRAINVANLVNGLAQKNGLAAEIVQSVLRHMETSDGRGYDAS